jgi:hypothetical protein
MCTKLGSVKKTSLEEKLKRLKALQKAQSAALYRRAKSPIP